MKTRSTYFGIRIARLADGRPAFVGTWLAAFTPERDRTGTIILSYDPAYAIRFRSIEDAMAYYHQPHGIRDPALGGDGEPNRPLTMFDITVSPLPDIPHVATGLCPLLLAS